MSALERRAVAALACLYVFRMLGLFMLLPVLPLYAADYALSTPVLVGLALGIYGLGQALLQIPLGMLSDRVGRKPVIIGGLLLFAAGGLLAASAESIFTVILGRLLQGAGAIASTLTATVADLTREQHRSKAMAVIGMSIGVSFGIAMVIGPGIASVAGISGLFLVTAALAGVGVVITLTLIPSPQVQLRDPRSQPLAGMLIRCLQTPDLMRLNIGVFVLHAAMMALFLIIPGRLQDLGMVPEHHWYMYLPVMAGAFVLMVPGIIVAETRQWHTRMLRIAIILLILIELAAAVMPTTLLTVTVVLLIFFTGFNYLEASLPALLSRIAYAGGKGTAMGVFASFQVLGAFCGGALGGWLLGHWGEAAVFLAAALAAVVWLLCTRHMALPARNISLSLRWHSGEWTADRLKSEVLALPGAMDMTVFEPQSQAYLRVEQGFDTKLLPAGIDVHE